MFESEASPQVAKPNMEESGVHFWVEVVAGLHQGIREGGCRLTMNFVNAKTIIPT